MSIVLSVSKARSLSLLVILTLLLHGVVATCCAQSFGPGVWNALPEVTDEELAGYSGDGWASALGGAMVGAALGYTSYLTDYWYDRIVNRRNTAWDWGEVGKRCFSGATTGLITGALAPAP